MRTVYHFVLSPFSRKVRIMLAEKKLDFKLVNENFWQRRREFLAMNPSAQVPVLVEEDGRKYADSTAICEYIEEQYPSTSLLWGDVHKRAEIRRLSGWFNNKFYYEVSKYCLDEKVYKFLRGEGEPDTSALRAARYNAEYHLDYIVHLTKNHTWLAGDQFSLADVTAAAHISAVDYLGDIPWEHNAKAKQWYSLVKSRPSMRTLMHDRLSGFSPSTWYEDPDF